MRGVPQKKRDREEQWKPVGQFGSTGFGDKTLKVLGVYTCERPFRESTFECSPCFREQIFPAVNLEHAAIEASARLETTDTEQSALVPEPVKRDVVGNITASDMYRDPRERDEEHSNEDRHSLSPLVATVAAAGPARTDLASAPVDAASAGVYPKGAEHNVAEE